MASETIAAKRPRWTVPEWLRGLLVLSLMASALFFLSLGWTRSSTPLVVEIDGESHAMRTHSVTVEAALRHAGIALHPKDRVTPGLGEPLPAGGRIRVVRARPVKLTLGADIRHLRTHASTVGELLMEEGEQVQPADKIWLNGRQVGPDTPLESKAATADYLPQGIASPSQAVIDNQPHVVLQRATSLILNDNGVTETFRTTALTLGHALEAHNVTVYLGDQVTPGLHSPIVPGLVVAIQRSIPVVIEVDGRKIHTRTRAETVAGLLGQEGIALLGMDRVIPALDAAVRPDATVRVTRVREELVAEFEPIPFETIWVPDPKVEIDNTSLVQEGEIGLTKRRYRVTYENDQEVARFLEDVWPERPPVTKTLAYGTKIVVRTMDTPDGPIEYWRRMRVYTTSYTAASAGKPRDHPRFGYTRLGWWLTKGIVAVDPTVIPLRSRLYVPGYGVARAGDTGGGVKGKFVDLGFDESNYESWHWWTDVYLLTPVPPPDQIRWVLPNWPRYPDRSRR